MPQAKRREKKPLTLDEPGAAAPGVAVPGAWQKPTGLSRRGWLVLGACLLLINVPVLHFFLRGHPEANVALPFHDDFNAPENLQDHYFTTGGLWRVREGELFSPGVKNNPLWLKAKLPRDVRVEFDAKALSPEGDIRAEIFGNGVDHLSGYEVVLGGWNNTRAALIRGGDENAPTLAQLESEARVKAAANHLPTASLVDTGTFTAETAVRVEVVGTRAQLNTAYHFVLERHGARLRWSLNGQPLLEFTDPLPLEGPNHDRFGLSSAEGDVSFDNLTVTALSGGDFPEMASVAPKAPAVAPGPFSDSFARSTLGPDWLATDPSSLKLEDGALVLENTHNHPVWLRRPLPDPVRIELDAWTDSPDGDIKVELFGDGASFHTGDPHAAYLATGYVLVMGGWHNTISAIARMQEHGEDRNERSDVHVEPGRHYHWTIERTDAQLTWAVDGKPFLKLDDAAPLRGPGHEYFAFSGWESRVHFTHLTIRPR